MDPLILLQREQDAGLRLQVADSSLKISGPRKAEPLVRLLAEHKAALRKVQQVQKVQGTDSRGTSTERDLGPYASALAALRAKCPDYVPEDRWRQAIANATAFTTKWGAQAEAFFWTERELFSLHPMPERPAANYSRSSRLDEMGLIWLLRGRRVIMLTAMEAIMRCESGATLVYRRQNQRDSARGLGVES